jgi:NAD(P)H-binding
MTGDSPSEPQVANPMRRRRRPSKPVKKANNFDRAIDDLVLKKYGNGHIYYGERARLREGEEPEEAPRVGAEEGNGDEQELLKENAVLVVGGTGRTGQWVTLGLLNQGFNVRVLTREFERAEKLFGPSGSNVDVFQGDLSDSATLVDAVEGVEAIVIAAAPEWWRIGGSAKVEGAGAASLIRAATASETASSIKRIIMLSAIERVNTKLAAVKAIAEAALQDSGLRYTIVRVPKLSDMQGGINRIIISQEKDANAPIAGRILSRVDAAQIVCQCLVYDRTRADMAIVYDENGLSTVDKSMLSGITVVTACNDNEPAIVDKNYWREQFDKLQEE